jgi:hypothetical protein
MKEAGESITRLRERETAYLTAIAHPITNLVRGPDNRQMRATTHAPRVETAVKSTKAAGTRASDLSLEESKANAICERNSSALEDEQPRDSQGPC